jgi:DNA helicase-2/ATP-dependent DNA helicase PcrA
VVNQSTPAPTPEQQRVIEAPLAGPHLVDAGAGTGKTFTLVARATHLVERKLLRPSELLVLTFTNKAAAEIGDRLVAAFHDRADSVPTCATFHGLAGALLREFAYDAGDHSPDVRAIDRARAQTVFHRAFTDLLEGKLGVDLSALPLLDRLDELERSLSLIALERQSSGLSLEIFERDALAAAAKLADLPFGWVWEKRPKSMKCTPSVERTVEERMAESGSEAANVRAVAAVFRRFEDDLREEALITYGSLLSDAVAMLTQFPHIAQTLRRRWRHALVDEYQDTNPQQVALLRAIFGDALTPVLAVGDLRQAIYGFNGADAHGIRRFGELAGCTTYPLSLNRRSYQAILDAAHAVLEPGDALSAETLVAHKGDARAVAVSCRLFDSGENIATHRAAEANAIASEIAALRTSGVPAKEIAILLRTRSNALIYADALGERGIASKRYGGTGFFDAPEIIDALSWLDLLLEPDDPYAYARLLGSPAFGLSDGTLAQLAEDAPSLAETLLFAPPPPWLDAPIRAVIERFRAIAERLARALGGPVDDLVRTIVVESGIDVGYGMTDVFAAARVQANLEKFVALAASFAADRPTARAVDFAREIAERRAVDAEEAEAEIAGEQVSIMTVHAAKGLEWEHVFVADVTPGVFPMPDRFTPVVAWERDSGALAFRYGADGKLPLRWALRKPHDPQTGELRLAKKDEAEERRLFYVALTRAANHVYVSGSAKGKSVSPYLRGVLTRHAETTFGTTEPAVAHEIERWTDDATTQERIRRFLAEPLEAPTLFAQGLERVSYTAVAAYETCPRQARYRYVLHLPDLRDEEEPVARGLSEGGVRSNVNAGTYGTIVHRVLEVLVSARLQGEPENLDFAVETGLREADISDDPPLAQRVRAASTRALIALGELEPIEAEREFDLTIAGTRVFGFIDLLARDRAGRLVVIDYKTGHLAEDAYRLQLSLYRHVVHVELGEDPALAILRITDNEAQLVMVEPEPDARLEEALRAASTMAEDTPRPGPYCTSCAYVGVYCPEGAGVLRT